MNETLTVVPSGLFRKDVKRLVKRRADLNQLRITLRMLAARQSLPAEMRDHALIGNYRGYRECHIEPDWLLIYCVKEDQLILVAFRTGTHSDLY